MTRAAWLVPARDGGPGTHEPGSGPGEAQSLSPARRRTSAARPSDRRSRHRDGPGGPRSGPSRSARTCSVAAACCWPTATVSVTSPGSVRTRLSRPRWRSPRWAPLPIADCSARSSAGPRTSRPKAVPSPPEPRLMMSPRPSSSSGSCSGSPRSLPAPSSCSAPSRASSSGPASWSAAGGRTQP